MGVVPLSGMNWLFSLGIGASVFPVGLIGRVFIPDPNFHWIKYQSNKKEKDLEKDEKDDKDEKDERDVELIEK